jgi:hypothetical protein
MNLKNILSRGAFALGFVLVICGWLLFGDRSDKGVFVLDIIVSLFVYSVLFSDFLISWYRPEDKTQRRIVNLGLRWGATTFYAMVAISIIVLSHIFSWPFGVILFAHGIAIVLLIVGCSLIVHSASNIASVTHQHDIVLAGLDMMRREVKALHYDIMDKGTIPTEISQRVAQLVEDMRFISPANSEDARDLEQRFVDIIGRVRIMVTSFTLNNEELAAELSKAERILKERKATFSK